MEVATSVPRVTHASCVSAVSYAYTSTVNTQVNETRIEMQRAVVCILKRRRVVVYIIIYSYKYSYLYETLKPRIVFPFSETI